MGPELISERVWDALFPSSGQLAENTSIGIIRIPDILFSVISQEDDQLDNYRPVNGLGDIGAIEIQ